jgi:Tol biopolymer transport system component
VHADPRPVTDFNPTIPAELRRIIRRCLAKDPDQRFQTMKDLANALRDLVDEYDQLTPAGVSAARSISTSPARANPWPRLGVVALILIIAGLVLYLLRERNEAETRPRADMRIMPVTTHGQAVSAAISPDGRYVVYTTYHRGLSGIRVRQLATNSEIDARPPTRETYYARARFSPDGERLYVLEFPGGGTTSVITTLPTLGGEPREVLRDVASLPAFSPDGKSLAFIRRESPAHTLFIADANGTNARAIATRRPPESLDDTVAWSPDGKWIAVITGKGNRAVPEMLSLDGKERRAITDEPWFSLEALEWIPDMSGVIAVGQLAEIGIGQLWRISLPDGHATRVTNDLNDYNGVSIAASGRSLATMQTEWRARIWRHDLAKNESTPITEEQVSHIPTEFELLPDGSFLFHSSEGGESTDIWWLAPDGASKKQLTSDRAREFSPTASRAGDVVYYAHESDTGLELWAMNARGGAQRSVAKLPAVRSVLDASPDGRSVLVVAPEGLVLVSTSDGSRRVLTTAPVARATYSPDGRWIAARVRTPDRKRKTILLDANSGATVRELPIVEQEGIALEWTADSRNLISVEYGDGADNLWLRPVDGSAPRQLTRFTSDAIIGVQAPADGKAIYFSRGTSTADAVLVSNF